MLDVHAPHESIHTWKGFFIHIAAIACGLLLALARESRGISSPGRPGRLTSPFVATTAGIQQGVRGPETRDVVSKSLLLLRPHSAKGTDHFRWCQVFVEARARLEILAGPVPF